MLHVKCTSEVVHNGETGCLLLRRFRLRYRYEGSPRSRGEGGTFEHFSVIIFYFSPVIILLTFNNIN